MIELFTLEYREEYLRTFWSQVNKTPTCWFWTGARQGKNGAGTYRGTTAHRVSYEIANGLIPEKVESGKKTFVCHRCDIKFCVNPEHLYLGDNSSNIQDWLSRGYLQLSCKSCGEGIASTESRLVVTLEGKRGWMHSVCYGKFKGLISSTSTRNGWSVEHAERNTSSYSS